MIGFVCLLLSVDLANPKSNKKTAGFTLEEREGFTDLLSCGFLDSFRCLYPDKEGAYTFWAAMSPTARAQNVGWSVDNTMSVRSFRVVERLIIIGVWTTLLSLNDWRLPCVTVLLGQALKEVTIVLLLCFWHFEHGMSSKYRLITTRLCFCLFPIKDMLTSHSFVVVF